MSPGGDSMGREETAGRDEARKPKFPVYLQSGPDSFGKLGVANYIQNFVFSKNQE